ncbi:MAG: 6-phosphofructokinase [Ruminococcaceae bacterium]|nr:6-phosphofructokinase [Oscillospiraceae bacterium]
MDKQVKAIGILTSGGDAPGMNAAVRAVTRAALNKGLKVFGIRKGYKGLIERDAVEMNLRSVSDIINRGGTALYTDRCLEFKEEEGIQKGISFCKELGIEGLVVVGGDGSFRGARDLSVRGIPCVGIPGTIDNDITCTEYTIGFDTAMNTVVEMVDRIRDTCESHDRCSVVVVMGAGAGYIALHTGIACGATAIIIPEKEYDIQKDVIDRINEVKKTGKHHYIVMVAEGIAEKKGREEKIYRFAQDLAHEIEEKTGVVTRANVLGHVQRGGAPTLRDRVVASEMGYHAVELLSQGIGNRVVVMKDGKISDLDILEALNMPKVFDDKLYEIANTISL